MDVVATAFAGVRLVSAKPPHTVDTPYAVEQTGIQERRQRSIQSDPVQNVRLFLSGDLLMRKGTIGLTQNLQNDLPCPGGAQTGRAQ